MIGREKYQITMMLVIILSRLLQTSLSQRLFFKDGYHARQTKTETDICAITIQTGKNNEDALSVTSGVLRDCIRDAYRAAFHQQKTFEKSDRKKLIG